MEKTAEQVLQEALTAWDWNALVVGAVRYGAGHINDTFCVYTPVSYTHLHPSVSQRCWSEK